MSQEPHPLPCKKCSDRGDGKCFFCGLSIREEIPQPHKELPGVPPESQDEQAALDKADEYLSSHSAEEIINEAEKRTPNKPEDCPDPLCLLDITDPTVCQNCPRKSKHHKNCPPDCEYANHCQTDPQREEYCPRPKSWGGRRTGAGAPPGNLNRLVHGQNSNLIKRAISKLAADPELRAFLLLIARAATEEVLPQTTRQLITKALETPQVKGRRLYHKVKQLAAEEAQP